MKIVVILPTYNEKENIGLMVEALEAQFERIDHDMHILVVDDNSPDGTAAEVRNSMERFENIHLLSGEKRGLGAAYIRGFGFALNRLDADAVMEMDSDFSHNPEDVPRLISCLDQGADFAIGSRYIPGGSIPDDWGLKRKMLSRWGNIFTRHLAGLCQVRDCTAGFRAIRASLLKRMDLAEIKVEGYAFQVALLGLALEQNAAVAEIPVHFVDRLRGETKLGVSDVVEFFMNIWWMRRRTRNDA